MKWYEHPLAWIADARLLIGDCWDATKEFFLGAMCAAPGCPKRCAGYAYRVRAVSDGWRIMNPDAGGVPLCSDHLGEFLDDGDDR